MDHGLCHVMALRPAISQHPRWPTRLHLMSLYVAASYLKLLLRSRLHLILLHPHDDPGAVESRELAPLELSEEGSNSTKQGRRP